MIVVIALSVIPHGCDLLFGLDSREVDLLDWNVAIVLQIIANCFPREVAGVLRFMR